MSNEAVSAPAGGAVPQSCGAGAWPAVLVCLTLTALADALFYRQWIGWALGAFSVALLLAMAATDGRLISSRPGRVILALLLGLCLAFVEQPTVLAAVLFAAGLVSLVLASRPAVFARVGRWLEANLLFAGEAVVRLAADGGHLLGVTRGGSVTREVWRTVLVWMVPVVLSLVFLALFASANPIIESWLVSIEPARLLGSLPEAARVLFWLGVGAAVWVLLRTRIVEPAHWQKAASPANPGTERGDMQALLDAALAPATVVRALLLFNLVFALQNGMDVAYLWAGTELPPGYTYAGYAHRSAYPLIATVLIAAVFVLIAFRPGAAAADARALRWGMYLWIAQNVLLVASAIRRTLLYVEAYSLTYLRLAALIWMGLVALGLLLLVIRFASGRSNQWLLGGNVLATLGVLYAVAFVDLGRIIAEYNVAHAVETAGKGPRLDVPYLIGIGPSALPALRRVRPEVIARYGVHVPDESAPHGYGAMRLLPAPAAMERLARDAQARAADWRGWTWRGHRLTRELEAGR